MDIAEQVYKKVMAYQIGFGSTQLKEISPADYQKLLDGFAEKGQTKTNNEVYSKGNNKRHL